MNNDDETIGFLQDDSEKIQKFIDINEIQVQKSNFIAAVEQSPMAAAFSFHPRKRWYQQYSLPGDTYIDPSTSDRPKYQVGDTVESIEAVLDQNDDVRPKIFDNKTKSWVLLDSGSCVSCVPKEPDDVIDPYFKLRSVNGGSIATFGTRQIEVRIGRKEYSIEAVIADIPQQILGWDLFRKYRLGFEWNETGDLFVTDNKANIKSLLKFVKLEGKPLRVSSADYYQEPEFSRPSNEEILFNTKCMERLDTFNNQVSAMTIDPEQEGPYCDEIPLPTEEDPAEAANLKVLPKVPQQYAELIKEFPDILKCTFKSKPAEGIYHRIHTTGEPTKSKVRPLLANSEKSIEGKKLWNDMAKLGVIERVKPNSLTTFTSPLHMVRKPNGKGWRVCADFRGLNSRTTADNYPLPILRSFTQKIQGSKIFSTIDLKNAFYHLPIHPEDENKTCVLSPWGGAYVYKRLAFGMTNGPDSWQKYVDSILGDIPDIYTLVNYGIQP